MKCYAAVLGKSREREVDYYGLNKWRRIKMFSRWSSTIKGGAHVSKVNKKRWKYKFEEDQMSHSWCKKKKKKKWTVSRRVWIENSERNHVSETKRSKRKGNSGWLKGGLNITVADWSVDGDFECDLQGYSRITCIKKMYFSAVLLTRNIYAES